MVLERIAGRRTELTSEVELLRKQLADAEHELERLVIAEQVITQLEVATDWGRYAELYSYDANHQEYRLDPAHAPGFGDEADAGTTA